MSKTHALGQNFLIVPETIETIVDTFLVQLSKIDLVPRHWIEIGPGEGALTLCLSERLKRYGTPPDRVTLFERDRDLVAHWTQQCPRLREKHPEITWSVSEGDFVQAELGPHLPACVISNLPYSAATAILLKLTESVQSIPWMVLMFQKEVGLRLLAEPSTPDRGSLTLWVQNRWEVSRILDVPPHHFRPAPKVDSIVLGFRARARPLFPNTSPGTPAAQKLDRLLRSAFAQRRKMLRGVLGKDPAWKKALEISGVDGTKRAEALVLEEWLALFQAQGESQ